jgi:pimeloyl-ACP methyl ester carboxylesterase
METVRHHGRSTAYKYSDRSDEEVAGRDSGERRSPPGLCCIHGSGGSHEAWKSQFRLASQTPVAAVDLSGHGESEDIDADAGYETLSAYADDVVAVVEATDCSVLVGHSLGGAVALWVALERDLELDGLVLVGTGPRLPVLAELLDWLATDYERAIEFLHGPDRLLHDPEAKLRTESIRLLRAAGQPVVQRDFRTCNRFNVLGRLDEIDLPAAAIVGEYDQITPFRYHEYFTEELPNCSLVRIRNAAHLVMLEQPLAFNAVVSGFLDRLTQ